jgi:hypothetical protein
MDGRHCCRLSLLQVLRPVPVVLLLLLVVCQRMVRLRLVQRPCRALLVQLGVVFMSTYVGTMVEIKREKERERDKGKRLWWASTA